MVHVLGQDKSKKNKTFPFCKQNCHRRFVWRVKVNKTLQIQAYNRVTFICSIYVHVSHSNTEVNIFEYESTLSQSCNNEISIFDAVNFVTQACILQNVLLQYFHSNRTLEKKLKTHSTGMSCQYYLFSDIYL